MTARLGVLRAATDRAGHDLQYATLSASCTLALYQLCYLPSPLWHTHLGTSHSLDTVPVVHQTLLLLPRRPPATTSLSPTNNVHTSGICKAIGKALGKEPDIVLYSPEEVGTGKGGKAEGFPFR